MFESKQHQRLDEFDGTAVKLGAPRGSTESLMPPSSISATSTKTRSMVAWQYGVESGLSLLPKNGSASGPAQ
jgi:hypothetical protein